MTKPHRAGRCSRSNRLVQAGAQAKGRPMSEGETLGSRPTPSDQLRHSSLSSIAWRVPLHARRDSTPKNQRDPITVCNVMASPRRGSHGIDQQR
jgi:hypothetical protein